MSEQVGASPVLAQIFLPLATGPQSPDTIGPALPADELKMPPDGVQPVDIAEESTANFASLLNELATLEIRNATTRPGAADGLIHVRVETAATPEAPAAGNILPPPGNLLPANGMILPPADGLTLQAGIQSAPSAAAIQVAEVPASPPSIVVREALGPEGQNPSNAQELRESGNRNITPTEPPRPTAAGNVPAAPPALEQIGDTRNQQPTVRATAIEVQGAAGMTSLNGEGGDGTTGDDMGDSSGQQERQDSPRQHFTLANGRSASISFGHETAAIGLTPGTALSAAPAPGAGTAVSQAALSLLGSPADWAGPLAERLATFASRGANTAEVKLHPPSLGALEVRITVSNDQASLWVASANPEVRDALQQALPRLENLLGDLGIELADSEITDRSSADTDPQGGGRHGSNANAAAEADGVGDRPAVPLGLLDTWA